MAEGHPAVFGLAVKPGLAEEQHTARSEAEMARIALEHLPHAVAQESQQPVELGPSDVFVRAVTLVAAVERKVHLQVG